jgi:sugar O-acyltransferase (sialic acid O-acetyltransferase NeuD family)
MKSIILIGGGGHCRSCIDVIEQEGIFKIAGIVERENGRTENVLGYPLIGTDKDLSKLRIHYDNALVTFGQIKDPEPRIRLFTQLEDLEYQLPTIISPISYISNHSHIGEGTIVMHDVIVNAGAKIGSNCILNNKSLVEHDAVVEDHCHLSTGSIINGEVSVGRGTFIGSGSVIREGVRIGKNCTIAARRLVIQDLPDSTFFRNTI